MPSNLWSKEDTEYLISERKKKTEWYMIAEKLNRTRDAVKARIKFLSSKHHAVDLNDLSNILSQEELIHKTGG